MVQFSQRREQYRQNADSPQMIVTATIILMGFCLFGCGGAPPPAPTTGASDASAMQPKQTITVADAGLQVPESVLYVADEDVYLVSNINGSPLEKDGNGFISKVAPDGSIIELKWISGDNESVTLNAPKGMVIAGKILYVTDIDTVRMFEKKTGAPKGEVAIEGRSFLNDLTVSGDGTVFVTDTGWKAGAEGFEPTGTDAIFSIVNGAAAELVVSTDLHQPNGVLAVENGLLIVSSAGELISVSNDGTLGAPVAVPGAGLDGIVKTGAGTLLVSSWAAKTVYTGTEQGDFKPVIENITSPADIGYDSKRNRVLIPVFLENKLIFLPL